MDNKKIYVTGYKGMIGSRLIEKGCSPFVCDVRDIVMVDTRIQDYRPDVIIHLAYKANVDYCEQAGNRAEVDAVNIHGSNNLFSMAEKYNIPVVFVSSDQVFSGNWMGNYKETSTDLSPKNYYGFTKLAVEASVQAYDNVNIVRTSTVFTNDNYLPILDKIRLGEEFSPPAFMWRSFMHVDHLTDSLVHYANNIHNMPKVLHLSGSRNVSWYRFMHDYARMSGLGSDLVIPRFRDTKTAGMADRPSRSGLSTALSGRLGFRQHDYMDGIRLALAGV